MKDRKEHAARILGSQAQLERTARDAPADGYSINWWGGFWNDSIADGIEQVHADIVGASRSNEEWFAANFRLAGFLKSRMKLEAALSLCELMEIRAPSKAAAPMSLQARILARQGRLGEAEAVAAKIDAMDGAAFFRVSKEELLRAATNDQED